MALLLLRHALSIGSGDNEDDASTFFSVSGLVDVHSLILISALLWLYSINVDTGYSFSCSELLVFFFHATLWPGLLVSCNVEGKDRLA